MNRRDRRAHRKLARDAAPGEIFPERHGPIQSNLADLMPQLVRIIRDSLGPNYDVTLFVAERVPPDNEERLPRFNYVSTADRRDMIAVLGAFVAKQRAEGSKLDMIRDDPPTGAKQ